MTITYPKRYNYTGREIEQRAMDLVMEFERKHNRNPEKVHQRGCGYDIESSGRFIEVKGMSHKTGDFISLYKKLLVKLGSKISSYYIYVVYDMKNKPKLKIIPPDTILANLEIETSFFIKAKSYRGIKAIEL